MAIVPIEMPYMTSLPGPAYNRLYGALNIECPNLPPIFIEKKHPNLIYLVENILKTAAITRNKKRKPKHRHSRNITRHHFFEGRSPQICTVRDSVTSQKQKKFPHFLANFLLLSFHICINKKKKRSGQAPTTSL